MRAAGLCALIVAVAPLGNAASAAAVTLACQQRSSTFCLQGCQASPMPLLSETHVVDAGGGVFDGQKAGVQVHPSTDPNQSAESCSTRLSFTDLKYEYETTCDMVSNFGGKAVPVRSDTDVSVDRLSGQMTNTFRMGMITRVVVSQCVRATSTHPRF